MDDEKLERRMRDWNLAEAAAKEAERAARSSVQDECDGIESPVHRAARLRRAADAILASILEDVQLRGPTYSGAAT